MGAKNNRSPSSWLCHRRIIRLVDLHIIQTTQRHCPAILIKDRESTLCGLLFNAPNNLGFTFRGNSDGGTLIRRTQLICRPRADSKWLAIRQRMTMSPKSFCARGKYENKWALCWTKFHSCPESESGNETDNRRHSLKVWAVPLLKR
jgi:hypothetical protein